MHQQQYPLRLGVTLDCVQPLGVYVCVCMCVCVYIYICVCVCIWALLLLSLTLSHFFFKFHSCFSFLRSHLSYLQLALLYDLNTTVNVPHAYKRDGPFASSTDYCRFFSSLKEV